MRNNGGIQLDLFRYKNQAQAIGAVAGDSDGQAASFLVEIWTERELEAWAPAKDLRVSEWAEQFRMLPTQSAASGEWSNLPFYTVEVMDAFRDPYVERITIKASVQSSKTESIYNMLGYAISQDPAPALVVMPSLTTLRRVNKRIETMIRISPELAKHLTGNPDDVTRQEIRLDNMSIYFATAGSSMDLRNVEARYIFCDETDDYEAGVGGQGSPIEMAEARSTTYWNRKINHVCTPTFEHGYIAIEYKRSDRSKYWVPCPHCGGYQVLSFRRVKHKGEKLDKWPKSKRDPEYIRLNRAACYECEYCGAEIDDRDKRWMLKFGTWVPEGHPIERDGTVAIPRPRASHRGFWWSALYSPWVTFSDLAARFWAAKGDLEKHKTFVTLFLAEEWKEKIQDRKESEILILRDERPRGIVPSSGVLGLTCGADTQDRGFFYVIRAWGKPVGGKLESWLIREGSIETLEALKVIVGGRFQDVNDKDYIVSMTLVDAMGHRTSEVYDFCKAESEINASQGAQKMGSPYSVSIIEFYPNSNRPIPGGCKLYRLNSNYYKDSLYSKLCIAKGDPGAFNLHAEVGEDYAKHMVAEFVNAKGFWDCPEGRPNHYWDCEYLALAAADIQGIQHWGAGEKASAQAKPTAPAHSPVKHSSALGQDRIQEMLRERTVNPWAGRR